VRWGHRRSGQRDDAGADINGLVVDSNVLLRGVQVGKVTGIQTSLAGATVAFYVDKDFPIPLDTEVRLENLSALGESYIGMLPRTSTGPTFTTGNTCHRERGQPASISELATSVVRVLDQLDPAPLSRLVGELDRALPDKDVVLPNLARASLLLRNAVTSMDGGGRICSRTSRPCSRMPGSSAPEWPRSSCSLCAWAADLLAVPHAQDVVTDSGPRRASARWAAAQARPGLFGQPCPDLKVFAEAFTPNIKAIAAAAMNFDTGQILSKMLDAIPEDGTITLRVRPQPRSQ